MMTMLICVQSLHGGIRVPDETQTFLVSIIYEKKKFKQNAKRIELAKKVQND